MAGVLLFSSPSRARNPFPFHFQRLSRRLLETLRSDVTEKQTLHLFKLFHDYFQFVQSYVVRKFTELKLKREDRVQAQIDTVKFIAFLMTYERDFHVEVVQG